MSVSVQLSQLFGGGTQIWLLVTFPYRRGVSVHQAPRGKLAIIILLQTIQLNLVPYWKEVDFDGKVSACA